MRWAHAGCCGNLLNASHALLVVPTDLDPIEILTLPFTSYVFDGK